MTNSVNQLIGNTWHYFDRIVVTGLDPLRVLEHQQDHKSISGIAEVIRTHIALALYVREIGAEDLFFFQRPLRLCTEHLDQHAQEAGLVSATEVARLLGQELAVGYSLDLRKSGRSWRYAFSHPALSYVHGGRAEGNGSKESLAEYLAYLQADDLTAAFIRDVALARRSQATLGQLTAVDSRVLAVPHSPSPSVAEVAFNLTLPTIEAASVSDIVRLRNEARDEFEVFRRALSAAIEQRLGTLSAGDASSVAESVNRDILEPAMADLRRKVHLSRRLLGVRSEATLAAGSLVTTIGLIGYAPVVVPGLVIAAGGVVTAVSDYLKERRDAEAHDLHFLWRVSREAAGRHD
ncbi:hypothetical protein [Geodermatophilus normandii]|uniref:Uncharacterized protein n=1 Tax=Geodermatophilus normandii TaxID=1137989 RepID=A0A6P0GAF2_9ACTN|nr:hypothetical protein [Geodermatophilus normandii]NEM05172.1 hypothetical protein [Geodermatophilus normandii]